MLHGWISINANAETPFLPPFPSLPYLVFAGRRDRGSGSPCGRLYTRGLEGFYKWGVKGVGFSLRLLLCIFEVTKTTIHMLVASLHLHCVSTVFSTLVPPSE